MNAHSESGRSFGAAFSLATVLFSIGASTLIASPAQTLPAVADSDLADRLRTLDTRIVVNDPDRASAMSRTLTDDIRASTRAAHLRENEAWRGVTSRFEWEAFRDVRVRALRASLGMQIEVPKDVGAHVTGRTGREGYRVENLIFESRPGLFVTANLYLPADSPAATQPASRPGVLISHSHHSPKTQGELQDMGVTWARQGCAVLVPDHLGHGERRQHPFARAEDYPKSFKVGRQDYYARYATSMQLHLVGESLMGWMARDLMRGVDVLLKHAGADPAKILLIGAVAGGGDPAGVAAALDERFTAVAPFNFGGPQPDYAIPPDAERDFPWFGVPWWESTRCLRHSARDGFAQWVIVASVAPRKLLYCHEFGWDKERDPAWPRIARVFELYGASDHLAVAHGRGSLKGEPPDNTHCNNVGPVHRASMAPALQRWLGIGTPANESSDRRPAADLTCMTPEASRHVRPRAVHELAADIASTRLDAVRRAAAMLRPDTRRARLREKWAPLLGNVTPIADPIVTVERSEQFPDVSVERISLTVEPGIVVPLVLLIPPHEKDARLPVVIGFSQAGKARLLRERADVLASLLSGGAAVCLPDLRGTGETAPRDGGRGRNGSATDASQAELMLGGTMLGSRLRDLRSVLRYVRTRSELDAGRVALWGDSLAPPNPAGQRVAVPADADDVPRSAEPLGGLLALLGMLFEDDVRTGYANGGLVSYRSCLSDHFLYVPHDAVVPGAVMAGDLADLASVLAPRPLRLDGLVDGHNQPPTADATDAEWRPAAAAYRAAGADGRLQIGTPRDPASADAVGWILRALSKGRQDEPR